MIRNVPGNPYEGRMSFIEGVKAEETFKNRLGFFHKI